MTKEEIQKNSEHWYNKYKDAEKRIAELEAEVKEWKDKADLWCKTANLKDHNIMINKELEQENAELKEELKTAYRKGMRHMAKALKDYDRTDGAWTDYFEHTVDKVLQREQLEFEEYGTLADQLTKAKEILLKLLKEEQDNLYWLMDGSDKSSYFEVREQAKQFISEVQK